MNFDYKQQLILYLVILALSYIRCI